MKKFKFDLQDEDSLVVVDCKIHHHNFALAVVPPYCLGTHLQ
jgi:hypothetical protein